MESKDYQIGVLIGRFQVHELHDAHHYVIKQVTDNHKKVILFLGVPKTQGTMKNPLDYETRKKMIQKLYPEITILALPDINDDDGNKRWCHEIDKRIREVYLVGTVLLYGGRDSFIPSYKKGLGQFDCKELEQHTFVSGTEVRKNLSEKVRESPDFRSGIIYNAYNQFPRVHPCVDIAPFSEDGTEVLLSKKPNEDGWRFIGGFSSPNDESYESTARRKLIAKAGGIEIGDIKYVTSMKIDDWRYRSEQDKILTILFRCKYVFGRIEPSQEVSELKWFNLKWIRDNWYDIQDNHYSGIGIVKEHKELMKVLIKSTLD